MNSVILLLSDARGVYIPRDFLTHGLGEIDSDRCAAWGLTETNREWWEDAASPDSEFYWDAWEWILNNARYIDSAGNVYNLYQDGDLWALCYDRMTPEEKQNFGFDE